MLPHVSPDERTRQWILNLETIFLEIGERVIVKTNLAVHMVALVQDDCLNWSSIIQFGQADVVRLIGIAQDKVLNCVQLIL